MSLSISFRLNSASTKIWYQGTADAVYQNIYAIEKERPEYLIILAGDHIYKMNYSAMIQYHKDFPAQI